MSGLRYAWNLLHGERGGRCIRPYAHRPEAPLGGASIHNHIFGRV